MRAKDALMEGCSPHQLQLFAGALAESESTRAELAVANDRRRRPNSDLEVLSAESGEPSTRPDGTRSAHRGALTKPSADGRRTLPRLSVSPDEATISKRKASKTFRTLGEARRWRAAAQTQAAKGVRLAGTSRTLQEAAEAFVDGIASGAIRTKSGERYKPSVVREYERSLRLHVLPTLGGGKLSKIQRRDVQHLADDLLASSAEPSTIRNAPKPLQAIYRRAIEDGDLALNPCERLRLPAARGRRERIAETAAGTRRAEAAH